jgi:hypothetical protein
MNWLETMKQNANRAAKDDAFPGSGDMQGTSSTAWDPHEVWLTRVKQPRDRAAIRAMTATLHEASKRQD